MTINTDRDWWALLDLRWNEVKEIVFHHLDPNHPAYEIPGCASSKPTGRTIHEELEFLKTQQTHETGCTLCRYFNAVWGMASEVYAWSVPGWGDFCDLCSEEWVLD